MNKLPIRCSLCRTSVCQKASLPTLCRKPESQFSSLPTLRQKSSSPILSGCQFAAAHATHQFARNPVRRHVPESQKASSPTHPPSSQLTTDPMPLSPRKLTNSSTKGLKNAISESATTQLCPFTRTPKQTAAKPTLAAPAPSKSTLPNR